MSEVAADRNRTYGHWRKPRSAGLGRLGLAGTIGFFGCAFLFVLLVGLTSIWIAMAAAVGMALLLAPLAYEDRHGRRIAQNIATRMNWVRARRRRSNLYRAGAGSKVPGGRCRLPGVAAAIEAVDAQDAMGRRFALLHHKAKHHVSVVLATSPDGAALLDREQLDGLVAGWGTWLAQLGNVPQLIGAAVHIETAPDEGFSLAREIGDNIDPRGPKLARDVLEEIADTYPSGSATLTSRITLTWRMTSATGRRMKLDQQAAEIANRLPDLLSGLLTTGAGPARAMTTAELAAAVRVAWDPACAGDVESVGAVQADIDWADCGPVGFDEHWDWIRHDSGASQTWVMSAAPRGLVYDNVLAKLLAPHDALERKRVVLHYRPHDPGQAAEVVERDRRDAISNASGRRLAKARDVVSLDAAHRTAREEAAGAGVTRFSLTATVTLRDPSAEARELAAAAMEGLAASARIRIRPAVGQQAVTFCASLPLGLVLAEHSSVPAQLREAL